MVECLPGKHLFASYSHSIFRPQKPVEELFEQILKIGTTQHFAIVDGDYRKELSMLSDVMGFKYFEV
jgi:L-arabinose isomerase